MTIAIAAVCDNCIVTVSDRLISFGDVVQPSEGILKARKVCDGWGMLFAADNANLFLPYGRVLHARLQMEDSVQHSLENVKSAAQQAYQEMFNAEFSAQVLSKYRFDDISDFREHGLVQLGEQNFNKIAAQIDAFDVGMSVIIYGYDENQNPHIFQVVNPGVLDDNDIVGLSVVGAGRYIAMGSLMARGATKRSDLQTTIYRLLDAKFSAETASGVGRGTTCFTFHEDGEMGLLSASQIEKVREIWKQQQEIPPPKDALELIKEKHRKRGLTPHKT